MNNKIGNCKLNTWYAYYRGAFKPLKYDDKTVTIQEFRSINRREVEIELFKKLEVTGLLNGNNVSDNFLDILIVILDKVQEKFPYIQQDMMGTLYVSKFKYSEILDFKKSIKFNEDKYQKYIKENVVYIAYDESKEPISENIIHIPNFYQKLLHELCIWYGDNYTHQLLASIRTIKGFLDNSTKEVYNKSDYSVYRKDDIKIKYDLLLDKLVEAQEEKNIEDEYFIKGKLDVFRYLLNI